MKHWFLYSAVLLLLVGCEPSTSEQYLECAELLESGGYAYDVVSTEGWSIDGVGLWTTPDSLKANLGEPDYIESLAGSVSWIFSDPEATYKIIGDTVAYAGVYVLDDSPLVSGDRLHSKGGPFHQMRSLYPQSYRCRNYPYSGEPANRIVLSDTVRRAEIGLYYQEQMLGAVGVMWYGPELSSRGLSWPEIGMPVKDH